MRALLLAAAVVAGAAPGMASAQQVDDAQVTAAQTKMAAPILREPDAAFPLNFAYRLIGAAEQAGGSGRYLDAAKTHYRAAVDRYGRKDNPGASGEAHVALDLARAALDGQAKPVQPPAPKDIPAPPTPAPGNYSKVVVGGAPMLGAPGGPGPDVAFIGRAPMTGGGSVREFHVVGPGGPGMAGGMVLANPHFGGPGGSDATALAEVLKVETGAEARSLAQAAVDANAAAQRAALGGNVDEAARQSRVSRDLVDAVRDIAMLNHPELRRTQRFTTVDMPAIPDLPPPGEE
ncbi:MAG: hypothetical protein JO164_08800 [Candidatus Eremiobacteraeota bacterium]|nr:hypothetical protein [Candidatus Eremiobacteraeota bacterium]